MVACHQFPAEEASAPVAFPDLHEMLRAHNADVEHRGDLDDLPHHSFVDRDAPAVVEDLAQLLPASREVVVFHKEQELVDYHMGFE